MVNRMRQLDFIASQALNQNQKMAINYQKKNLISEMPDRYSSSEDEEMSEAFIRIVPKKKNCLN